LSGVEEAAPGVDFEATLRGGDKDEVVDGERDEGVKGTLAGDFAGLTLELEGVFGERSRSARPKTSSQRP